MVSSLEKDLNLIVHAHLIHQSLLDSLICLDGKSHLDLCFHPTMDASKISELGSIILPTDNGDEEYVIGSLAEFKSFSTCCNSQVFSNFIIYEVYLTE